MIVARPNNVIIAPFFDPDVSVGGIHIPSSSKERSDQGIVKYIGDDVRFVKVGDYVLFSGYSGTLIRLDGEGLLITMHERLIVAVIGSTDWLSTPVSGLFCADKNGNFFPATYEATVNLLYDTKKSFNERIRWGGWGKKNIIKMDYRPTPQELATDARWTETEKEIRDNQ